MFNLREIPFLPKRHALFNIRNAVFGSFGLIRFGRVIPNYTDLGDLIHERFDLELALSSDLCELPSGWLDRHAVRLPKSATPVTVDVIKRRLEHMVHAPRDPDAIRAILAAASCVIFDEGSRNAKRRRLIRSPETLANALAQVRKSDPDYVDALLQGELSRCVEMIHEGRLLRMQRQNAINLLLEMARLWMIYELQIISARLHKAMYRPTDGFIEGFDAGPQSFQAFAREPEKWLDMIKIAEHMLNPKPWVKTAAEKKDEQRLLGFANGTSFKAMAQKHARRIGLSTEDLERIDAEKHEHLNKIICVGRHFAARGALIGDAIKQAQRLPHDDRAPTRKNEKPKSSAHLSFAAIRYEMDAPTGIAHAIVAFIELSEQLPNLLDQYLNGNEAALSGPLNQILRIKQHHQVTFEKMLHAYRAIIIRDPNYLRGTDAEILPRTTAGDHDPQFKTNADAAKWRRDYILGRTSSVAERLGEVPLDPTAELTLGKPSEYGKESLKKALAIMKRNRIEKQPTFDPLFTPQIFWRFSTPPGG